MKLQYIKNTLHVAHFRINLVSLTKNIFKEVKVPKSRGALGTGFSCAPVLEAGGKPSTRFPLEEILELKVHARSMRMISNKFPHGKSKFLQKILKI